MSHQCNYQYNDGHREMVNTGCNQSQGGIKKDDLNYHSRLQFIFMHTCQGFHYWFKSSHLNSAQRTVKEKERKVITCFQLEPRVECKANQVASRKKNPKKEEKKASISNERMTRLKWTYDEWRVSQWMANPVFIINYSIGAVVDAVFTLLLWWLLPFLNLKVYAYTFLPNEKWIGEEKKRVKVVKI